MNHPLIETLWDTPPREVHQKARQFYVHWRHRAMKRLRGLRNACAAKPLRASWMDTAKCAPFDMGESKDARLQLAVNTIVDGQGLEKALGFLVARDPLRYVEYLIACQEIHAQFKAHGARMRVLDPYGWLIHKVLHFFLVQRCKDLWLHHVPELPLMRTRYSVMANLSRLHRPTPNGQYHMVVQLGGRTLPDAPSKAFCENTVDAWLQLVAADKGRWLVTLRFHHPKHPAMPCAFPAWPIEEWRRWAAQHPQLRDVEFYGVGLRPGQNRWELLPAHQLDSHQGWQAHLVMFSARRGK